MTGWQRALVLAGAAAAAMLASFACGTAVDLGGPADGGGLAVDDGAPGMGNDGEPLGAQCATCVSNSDCAGGLCAKFADYLFCTTACSTSASTCGSDQTCYGLLSTSGDKVSGCLPSDTKCAPDNGPIGPDGAPLEHCNTDLDGPSVTSTCKACGTDTDDCQPNGCYGGYWCDSDKTDCVMPPKTCM